MSTTASPTRAPVFTFCRHGLPDQGAPCPHCAKGVDPVPAVRLTAEEHATRVAEIQASRAPVLAVIASARKSKKARVSK